MEYKICLKIAIGCDHAAYTYKEMLKEHLSSKGFEMIDMGCHSATESVDYPDYAKAVCQKVLDDPGTTKGLLICGTGIGISIAANKIKGIRAGLCHDAYTSQMTREHNNANVLAIGERSTGCEVAK